MTARARRRNEEARNGSLSGRGRQECDHPTYPSETTRRVDNVNMIEDAPPHGRASPLRARRNRAAAQRADPLPTQVGGPRSGEMSQADPNWAWRHPLPTRIRVGTTEPSIFGGVASDLEPLVVRQPDYGRRGGYTRSSAAASADGGATSGRQDQGQLGPTRGGVMP